jgi:hypothetical protein
MLVTRTVGLFGGGSVHGLQIRAPEQGDVAPQAPCISFPIVIWTVALSAMHAR